MFSDVDVVKRFLAIEAVLPVVNLLLANRSMAALRMRRGALPGSG
jgi:hypothetical protein